jgi:hypothetical protein
LLDRIVQYPSLKRPYCHCVMWGRQYQRCSCARDDAGEMPATEPAEISG